MDRKQIGRIGLANAIAYYTQQGYTISLPINDTQWYDLIIEKDGLFQTVQCKATATEEGTIDFRNTGGTKGSIYGHTLDTNIDIIFCVDKNLNMFSIPKKDLVEYGVSRSITLRTTPTVNRQGFQTYKYLVNMGRYD